METPFVLVPLSLLEKYMKDELGDGDIDAVMEDDEYLKKNYPTIHFIKNELLAKSLRTTYRQNSLKVALKSAIHFLSIENIFKDKTALQLSKTLVEKLRSAVSEYEVGPRGRCL